MNLVGELVLTRNQVLQHVSKREDRSLTQTVQRLNLITTELQEGVMKTRMQPIGNLWNKFPRIVRDVAAACGKKVRLDMEGRDTELDKSILEAIKDPLTHIIRNSIDHGVEAPDVRRRNGKPEEGVLSMRAFHEAGQVHIEVTDDGKGINPNAIKHKAIEKGLLTTEQADRLSDRDAVQLVFAPGFSTAEKVTNVSGRGVGMDVVKTNVERTGGTVELSSQAGVGTTLRIRIPLTLAIIPAIVVCTGRQRFAIQQSAIDELLLITDVGTLETLGDSTFYRLRGELLPVVSLQSPLRLPHVPQETGVSILVLRSGQRRFGLVVDDIERTEEIVMKPIAHMPTGLSVFGGATIMGNGQVALILDLGGIARRAGINQRGEGLTSSTESATHDHPHKPSAETLTAEPMLLCTTGDNSPFALSLKAVARLEEIEVSRIEAAGDCKLIQYRDDIRPLLDVGALLDLPDAAPDTATDTTEADATCRVIVCQLPCGTVGLRVKAIEDIIELVEPVQARSIRPGVRGTVVILGKVTQVLDPGALASLADDDVSELPSSSFGAVS